MKLVSLLVAVFAFPASVLADGFVCHNDKGDLNVRIYNNVNPEEGTRTASTLVLSNPELQAGNKTIAVFRDSTGLLSSKELVFTADVDLRFKESSRKGELIAGTKLGNLDQVKVIVHFSYADPVAEGAFVPASLILTKRDGAKIRQSLDCRRYLKGE